MDLILVAVNPSKMDITINGNNNNNNNTNNRILHPLPPQNMEDEIHMILLLHRNTPLFMKLPLIRDEIRQIMMNPSHHPPSIPFMNLLRLRTGDEILLHQSKGCILDPIPTQMIIVYMEVCMMVVYSNIRIISSIPTLLKIIIVGLNRFQ
jgi:hypothetical protein